MPIKRLLLIFFTVLPTVSSNYVELPRVPDSSSQCVGWLLSSNDGFGHNYGTDEDNLRTFGIDAGAFFLKRFLLHGDWTSFTDRNRAYEDSKRIDEIRLLGGYRWLHTAGPVVNLSIYSGTGALLYGNFGSLKIQENAHGLGDTRPRTVPREYNSSSNHILWYLYSEVFFPKLFTNLHCHAQVTRRGDYTIDASGGYWIIKPLLRSSFVCSYKWNRVIHAGSAAENSYKRENGFWLSNKTLIGPLVLERAFNLNNLHQYSYAGIRLTDFRNTGDRMTGAGFSYALGWPIGHNSWIEFFRVYPFAGYKRLGLFLRTYHTENLIENNLTGSDDDRLLRRTKETSIGTELSFNDQEEWKLFDAFVSGGIGFTRDMKTTCDQFEARILALKTSFMLHGGCGLRVQIPDFIFTKYGRTLGAEIRANVRYNAKETGIYSNPDLLLSWGLVFSER